jgi:hypothetical protein
MKNDPVYYHDCEHCVFLGHYNGSDLYYHDQGEVTVIARYSSEPGDYSSGLMFGVSNTGSPELHKAYEIARSTGLIREEVDLYYNLTYRYNKTLDSVTDFLFTHGKNTTLIDDWYDFKSFIEELKDYTFHQKQKNIGNLKPLKVWKIKDNTTGLFYHPKMCPHWTKLGKVYTKRQYAQLSLRAAFERVNGDLEIVEYSVK